MGSTSKLNLKDLNQTSWTRAGPETEFRHLWICYNFSLGLTSQLIESVVFQDDDGHKWKMLLCQDHNSNQAYLLNLVSVDPNLPYVDATISFDSVDDKGNTSSLYKRNKYRLYCGNNKVAFKLSFPKAEALSNRIHDGNLRILFRIWKTPEMQSGMGPKRLLPGDKPHRTLATDFKTLFESSTFSDVTILSRGTTFSAHKAVLAARSDVFKSMLEAPMKESATNCITLDKFSPDVVNGMLKYFYSEDTTGITPELAQEFVEISNLYLLDGLKFEAESVLATNLDTGNAIQTFRNAVTLNCEILKSETIDFIIRNRIPMEKNQIITELARTHLEDVLELQKRILMSTS